MNRTRRSDQWEEARKYGQLMLPIVQQMITLSLRLRDYWESALEEYPRVEDGIICIYRETGSTAETARRTGFDRRCISRKLKELKEPVKRPGGSNNPYGRTGKPRNENPTHNTA